MTAALARNHAILSASSSKQWLNCPPSARLRERFPEETSEAAAEGTLAHRFCELKLRRLFLEPGMAEKEFKSRLGKLKKEPHYSPEMERFTDEYADYVQQIAYGYPAAPYVAVENGWITGTWPRRGSGQRTALSSRGRICISWTLNTGRGLW